MSKTKAPGPDSYFCNMNEERIAATGLMIWTEMIRRRTMPHTPANTVWGAFSDDELIISAFMIIAQFSKSHLNNPELVQRVSNLLDGINGDEAKPKPKAGRKTKQMLANEMFGVAEVQFEVAGITIHDVVAVSYDSPPPSDVGPKKVPSAPRKKKEPKAKVTILGDSDDMDVGAIDLFAEGGVLEVD